MTENVSDGRRHERITGARRLCFFAHYHHLGLAADHVVFYLDALRDAGFVVVVLSTAIMASAEADRLRAHCTLLMLRPNIGFDFGGWIEAFARWPDVKADLVLLANDSVYGPIGDLAAFVDRLTAEPADFYGAVESDSFGVHLQSWFVALRPSAYRSTAFRTFMQAPIEAGRSKAEIVAGYELALTRRLVEAGLTYRAAYRQGEVGSGIARRYGYNPTHLLWHELVERFGVPFIKVELLRYNPMKIRGLARAPALIAARAPALAPMIARDLATRAPPPRRGTGFPARVAALRDGRLRSYWPETQGALRRDARLHRGSLASRANAVLFHVAAAAGSTAYIAVHGGLRLFDLATRRGRGHAGPRRETT